MSPAYGRDYRTAAEARAAFLGGKDFFLRAPIEWAGAYCSVRDFAPGATVNVRFKGLAEVVPVEVPGR